MTRLILFIALFFALMAASPDVEGQRRVTPVTPASPGKSAQTAKPREPDRSHLAERLDAQGNIILVDTVTGLEFVDSTAVNTIGYLYPGLNYLDIGVDLWDIIMRGVAGQEYGIGSVRAQLSFNNRFFPLVEAGLGRADITPDGSNFNFRSPLAPFFKIGADYNVFYNNNPDYTLLVGLRYGFTPFKWSVDDVTVPGTYWDDPTSFAIPSQTATAGFLEVSLGVKVKLFGPVSAGWQFKFRSVLHESNNIHGEPMYIPGFGRRSNPVSGAFSLFFSIPMNSRRPKAVDNNSGESMPAQSGLNTSTLSTD